MNSFDISSFFSKIILILHFCTISFIHDMIFNSKIYFYLWACSMLFAGIVGVCCTRSCSQILLGTPYFVRNGILITKLKKNRNRLRIHRLSSIFCLSDEDRKKKFFWIWEKSLIDRISCFSINMAHMILNPYVKKYLSTKLYFLLKCQKSDFWGTN